MINPIVLIIDKRLFTIGISVIFLVQASVILAQTESHNEDAYKWFDQVIGTNNLDIYSGPMYREKFRMRNEDHKFFETPDFLFGTIHYNGQPYYDVALMYDLFEDEILARYYTILHLDKDKIDSFSIKGKSFVKIDNNSTQIPIPYGFYELLYETPFFAFLKRHKKRKKMDFLDDGSVYHEFAIDNEYYLHYRNNYYKIKDKKDLINVFPEFKNKINAYSNKTLRKLDKEGYLLAIINRITEMISEKRAIVLE